MGEWFYKHEYECEFVENEAQVLNYNYIMAALTDRDELWELQY